ncbi:MAG: tyrosine recombinase [Bacteroidales bacterium]|jgi:integrase/recombinase XerD|nr:tyrosine recombinase [Bacteroidales bacterium]
MVWEKYINGFKSYILLEKGQAKNTLTSYLLDLNKFFTFMNETYPEIVPYTTKHEHISQFINYINGTSNVTNNILKQKQNRKIKPSTQNRIIASLRAFFKFLLLENETESDPTDFIERAKLPEKLPEVLSNDEVNRLLNACDKSTYHGFRNYVIIEVLYSTGIRISELLNLKISDVFFKEEFIRVIGKGNKERLVPMGKIALKQLKIYIEKWRNQIAIAPKNEMIIFLTHKGKKISRQFIFSVLKDIASKAGITKNVYPHILRHSFATELVSRGANIMAVKDMMGHSSVRSTEIYTNFDTATIRETLMLYHPLYNKKK